MTGLDSFTAYDIRRKGDKTADFTRKHKKVGHLGFLFHPPTKTFFSEAAAGPYFVSNSNTNCLHFFSFRCPFRETILWVQFGPNTNSWRQWCLFWMQNQCQSWCLQSSVVAQCKSLNLDLSCWAAMQDLEKSAMIQNFPSQILMVNHCDQNSIATFLVHFLR